MQPAQQLLQQWRKPAQLVLMCERQADEDLLRLRRERDPYLATIRFIVAAHYQTAPHESVDQSYRAGPDPGKPLMAS